MPSRVRLLGAETRVPRALWRCPGTVPGRVKLHRAGKDTPNERRREAQRPARRYDRNCGRATRRINPSSTTGPMGARHTGSKHNRRHCHSMRGTMLARAQRSMSRTRGEGTAGRMHMQCQPGVRTHRTSRHDHATPSEARSQIALTWPGALPTIAKRTHATGKMAHAAQTQRSRANGSG